MAGSLALIILLGIPSKRLFEKLKLPGLIGMLLLGIIIGPYGLNFIQKDMLLISGDLRRIALIIILIRAGFGINQDDLSRIGIPALKMSFIPGLIEGLFIAFASIKLLNFSFSQGGILGFIIAAVSPAVVVPSMIKLMINDLGTQKGIPTLILAGASIDDVFAITIFSVFLGLYSGENINIGIQLLNIPISIILGIVAGLIIGYVLIKLFKRFKISDAYKILIILGSSIFLNQLENILQTKVQIASLLGVMTISFYMMKKLPKASEQIAVKFSEIWALAEILLFVLVGAQVDINVALTAGKIGIILIFIGLIGRSVGVLISLIGTDYNWKERLFCIIAYIPKATVQAAMGSVPLSLGVEGGEIILAIAVLSILITAPIGAIGINSTAERLLKYGN